MVVDTVTAFPFETEVDTVFLADGTHNLKATAFDGEGNSSTDSIDVEVDNTAPLVGITNPIDAQLVAGSISFDANASDAGSGLASLTLLVGGLAPTTDASQVYGVPVASDSVSGVEDTTRWLDGAVTPAGSMAVASVLVGAWAAGVALLAPNLVR